ncbi:hypothetical protein [Erythrobacter rubeus]|uniref:Cupin domain-containing protein n=1 Tax=Erythrobacter rubeus TaxID=2760803 RepID=A0ABR8KX00_9SPHN|nr:hypothetical protein [Erythrobacter rubeus]MBD2842686.1 hypothetical protein [Erythrobacter rubeus]
MSGHIFKAELPDLQAWAAGQMVRAPDFVIGDNYLRRWWILPRNNYLNIYLHEFRRSDDDRALHDHPWPSTSFIIEGGYLEHTPEGVFKRKAGDVVGREAEAMHRVELFKSGSGESPAVSLFVTGSKVREWGFDCAQGWVSWMDFTNSEHPGQVGRGCGEPSDPTAVTPRGEAPKREVTV